MQKETDMTKGRYFSYMYRTACEGTEALKSSYGNTNMREVGKESRAEPWKGTLEKTESTPTCNKLNKDYHTF